MCKLKWKAFKTHKKNWQKRPPPHYDTKKSRRALHVYTICTWRDEPYKTPFGIVSCVSRRHILVTLGLSLKWLWKIDFFFSKVHWLKTWPPENALINPHVFHRCGIIGPLTGRQLFYATLPRHHSRANLFSRLLEFPSMICDPDDDGQSFEGLVYF